MAFLKDSNFNFTCNWSIQAGARGAPLSKFLL
jgi:hypothetical protein